MANIDTGLASLVIILQNYKIAVDIKQLERAYVLEKGTVDTYTLIRAARDLKLKARAYENVSPSKLEHLTFPLIMKMKKGNYIVLHAYRDGEMFISISGIAEGIRKADAKRVLDDFTGEIILFTRRFELESEEAKFNFSWFIPVVKKYFRYLRNVLVLSLIIQLLGIATPIFTQVVIDKVLVHHSTDTLDVLILGMILCAIFSNFMLSLRGYLFTNICSKMDVALSSKLYRVISSLPIKYFDKWQVGDVVSRAGELETLRGFMTGSALTIVLDIVFSVVYIIFMLMYSKILSLVAFLIMPLFVILNFIIAPIYKKLINDRFLIGAENHSFLIEALTGIGTIKGSGLEVSFIEKYDEMLSRYVKSVFSVVNLSNIAGAIGSFIYSAFNLAILWVGAMYVMSGDISVGELIAFQMMAGQMIAPMMRLVNMWQQFQQVRVSMERLGDIMNEKQEPAFNPSRTTLPNIQGNITLERVGFKYTEEGSSVLDGVSVSIQAGMKVGIVGPSGSGKSTLTKLIQRLYLPNNGRIMIDGVDIAQVEPAWLRRQIGVVLQDSMLFGGTIEENIKIACPNATHENVVVAARLAGADSFIENMPHKYDTYVGERGSLLSGGQRQRIAIARALIFDPKIIIFDEATSALDYESESIIMNNIENIAHGRTMLMIAHRLSTVEDCDAIIVIDHGRIIEGGSHKALLQKKGAYYNLYMSQLE